MNILPHKSWHVRTKANIARVRKDQAKAAEEEAEKQRRVAVADYEARISLLRNRANQSAATQEVQETSSRPDGEIQAVTASQHVDLFADHEDKQKKVKPMDEEKRLEQEKYEKQIGYLTYLGQDTHEALGTQSWYNAVPKRESQSLNDESGEKVEIGLKVKHLHDPMMQFLTKKPITVDGSKMGDRSDSKSVNNTAQSTAMPALSILEKPLSRKRSASPDRKRKKTKHSKRSKEKREKKDKRKKHKKEKRKRKHSSSSDSSDSDSESEQLRQHKMLALQKLREERLQRERLEQEKTKELLRKKCPSLLPPEELKKPEEVNPEPRLPPMKQKYNSQFNPFLAKQNYH